ncbi:MAG TPA: hypothetical protein V6C86_14300 [Oculatellaceae cyanobacterium]
MSNPPDDEKKKPNQAQPLADELGVEDIYDPIAAGRGRLFSTAGRDAPIVEFTDDCLVLHPPQQPYHETDKGERISIYADDNGVLLDEFGVQKKMGGARFHGHVLYWMAEQKPGTTRHLIAWFDENNRPHKLFVEGEPVTTDMVYKFRNNTHDGEISIFPELESE